VGSVSRIRRGWALTGKSWALLRSHPALMRFPLLGTVAMIPVAVVPIAGLYLLDTHRYGAGVPVLAVGLYLLVFIGIYFGVGLAAAADATFHGREATFGDGMRAARGRLGAIAGWALVSAVVGTAFGALESAGQGLADIVGGLLNAAWGLITFLAVPVIAIEGTGPIETLKRSASLFKERWAGQVTGNVAIGGIVGLLGVLPAILLILVGGWLWLGDGNGTELALGAVLVAIGVVVFAISALILRALRGVFGVALYRFALDGEAVAGFEAAELESAVSPRR